MFGYLVKPFREHDLLPAVKAAYARHAELLAARRAVGTQGLLMQKDGCSEQRAFERLRRASQASGRPMRVIAESLIQTLRD